MYIRARTKGKLIKETPAVHVVLQEMGNMWNLGQVAAGGRHHICIPSIYAVYNTIVHEFWRGLGHAQRRFWLQCIYI